MAVTVISILEMLPITLTHQGVTEFVERPEVSRNPRFTAVTDVANAACFLASDEASYMTGTLMEVDGGRCI